MLSGEQNSLNIDRQLTDEVFTIMSNDEESIYASCARYFITVHMWYPILVKEEFYDRLENIKSMPMADFSILVFNIYYLGQIYRQPPRQKEDLKQLHRKAKSLHYLLVSAGRRSITLVQAGLLLALYEHTQALHDDAFQTIGICARMGYTLGFHKTLSPDAFPGDRDNKERDYQRLVWWGIIILER